jgi:hypothetical protein
MAVPEFSVKPHVFRWAFVCGFLTTSSRREPGCEAPHKFRSHNITIRKTDCPEAPPTQDDVGLLLIPDLLPFVLKSVSFDCGP